MEREERLAPYLAAWRLVPAGPVRRTPSSLLLDVEQAGRPAVLKFALVEEERRGGEVMSWWAGDGAAEVLLLDERAILLERAVGIRSLAAMARGDRDDEATRIACRVVARLHRAAGRGARPAGLPTLRRWFAELWPAASLHGGILERGARVAEELLATQREEVVLHGDVHHGNVLDFGARGWLAIDPKGILGDRAYDYANLLCNPDHDTALRPGRFAAQVAVIAKEAGLEPARLLSWVLAYCALSAAWFLTGQDVKLSAPVSGPTVETALAVAGLAERELNTG